MSFFFNSLQTIQSWIVMLSENHAILIYILVFLIIYVETGLIVVVFLPGDTLLFTIGAMSSSENIELYPLILIAGTCIAAILGDSTNHFIARTVRKLCSEKFNQKIQNKVLFQKAESLYKQKGGYLIFYAKFLAGFRSLIPFFSGFTRMPYLYFLKFSVLGAATWTISLISLGFFTGHIPIIRNNFLVFLIGVLVLVGLVHAVQIFRKHQAFKKNNGSQ